jgi:hypothetical protein
LRRFVQNCRFVKHIGQCSCEGTLLAKPTGEDA